MRLLACALCLLGASCAIIPPHVPSKPGVSLRQLNLGGTFWERTAYNDPDVHWMAGRYVMYLSRNAEDIYADGRAEPVSLFMATSLDGIEWTIAPGELLTLGSRDEWDHNKVETPSVVAFGGRYHLYYSGGSQYRDPVAYQIGHATSPDGVTWTKDLPNKPILTPDMISGVAGVLHVAEPGAVVFNGEVYLYFTVTSQRSGGIGPSAVMSIYLARSSDGTHFSAPVPVLSQTDRYPAIDGYAGYSTPSALVSGSGIELYYDVYFHTLNNIAPDEQVKIQRAVSADGVHFTEDAFCVLNREDTAFTAREIRGGSQMVENGLVKMWFSGDNYTSRDGKWAGQMGMGLATWTKD